MIDQPANLAPVVRLDVRGRIILLLSLVVVAVSTPSPRIAPAAFAAYAAMALTAWAAARVPPRLVFKRLAALGPFMLLVAAFVPFMHGGERWAIGPLSVSRQGVWIFIEAVTKGTIALLAMVLLSAVTPFAQLLNGLARLRVPAIFVMLLSVTHRYMFVLVEEARRMRRAADARGYGARWIWNAGVIGRLIGALFLRSQERAERIHMAMLARGFTGQPARPPATRWRGLDLAVTLGGVTALVAVRIVLT
jgi:cobalt/nickel transport system permease protein